MEDYQTCLRIVTLVIQYTSLNPSLKLGIVQFFFLRKILRPYPADINRTILYFHFFCSFTKANSNLRHFAGFFIQPDHHQHLFCKLKKTKEQIINYKFSFNECFLLDLKKNHAPLFTTQHLQPTKVQIREKIKEEKVKTNVKFAMKIVLMWCMVGWHMK